VSGMDLKPGSSPDVQLSGLPGWMGVAFAAAIATFWIRDARRTNEILFYATQWHPK
jgi:hypothetical protein